MLLLYLIILTSFFILVWSEIFPVWVFLCMVAIFLISVGIASPDNLKSKYLGILLTAFIFLVIISASGLIPEYATVKENIQQHREQARIKQVEREQREKDERTRLERLEREKKKKEERENQIVIPKII